MAQVVVDAQTIPTITPFINSTNKLPPLSTNKQFVSTFVDSRLQRQVLSCLSQIAKHSIDLAEAVVDGELFPGVLHCMRDPIDLFVRRNAAGLVCEICKHTAELAQLVVNSGGIAAIVDYISVGSKGHARLPGIMCLGYISAFNETLAMSVIVSKGIPALNECLTEATENFTETPNPNGITYEAASSVQDMTEEYIKAAICWSLGQIGRHSPEHAKYVSEGGILPKLLNVYLTTSTADSSGPDEGNSEIKNKVIPNNLIRGKEIS